AYKYAEGVVNKDIVANVDITLVCEHFLEDIEAGDDGDYFFDYNMVNKISAISQYVLMPSGIKVGKPIGSSLAGFQWFFIINALCWKEKDNHDKRRYEKSVLLIGRKNGKTFLTGFVFILLLLLEPRFSNFFSVAPDLELSSLIKGEMEHQIAVSPAIRNKFKIKKTEIICTATDSVFKPLATSNNRMDGEQVCRHRMVTFYKKIA
ncbi:terminase large subunit domain-containing protein, partial [Jeotgalibaca porci]|uniref:terminase large subunit domain-containing protein n=1 Tax=Jeotgalibaca porci TaxID=1868793 RepID=UPI00359FB3C1